MILLSQLFRHGNADSEIVSHTQVNGKHSRLTAPGYGGYGQGGEKIAKVTDDIKKLFEIVCRLTLEEWDTAKCLINEAFQDEMYIKNKKIRLQDPKHLEARYSEI